MTTQVVQETATVRRDDPVVVQDSSGSLTTIMLVSLVALAVIAFAVFLILHFTVGV
jgi:hypothetical protein